MWIGTGDGVLFFASTKYALELVEQYSSLSLRKRELGIGRILAVDNGEIVGRASFRPDMSFVEDDPLPAVRAPHERDATLARLAALHAA
jgi:hypothetical protein